MCVYIYIYTYIHIYVYPYIYIYIYIYGRAQVLTGPGAIWTRTGTRPGKIRARDACNESTDVATSPRVLVHNYTYIRTYVPSGYRDTSLIRKRRPPQDHHRSLGIGLLQGHTLGGGSYERSTSVEIRRSGPTPAGRNLFCRTQIPAGLPCSFETAPPSRASMGL